MSGRAVRRDADWSGAKLWALLALVVTLIGLLNFSIATTSWRADSKAASAKYPFVWEMTGAYAFLLVLPLMLAFMRRFPIDRRTLWRRLPLHLLVMAVLGVTHTLLMWGSRRLTYRALGWGEYQYGDMRYRFLMEGQKQLIGYWLVFAAVTVVAYVRRNRERELAAAQMEKQLSEARLAALKMQLNPHFLFNTLNMIASHVYDAPRTADAMIGHLSDFLRLTLRHSAVQEVPLETEIEFLNAYLQIMKARFDEHLAVELAVAGDVGRALVPHLILQPLVENSITHCMDASAGRRRLRVSAQRAGARLHLAVEDDGPGLAGEALANGGGGIGLSNTGERLRHLYGDEHRLAIANRAAGGVRVELELPFRLAGPAAPGPA